MSTVEKLLKNKKKGFWTVPHDATAYEALQIMADNDVGALLVVGSKRLLGIFTERDYSRKVVLKEKSSKNTLVFELMTTKVYCVSPSKTIDECMAIMNEKKVRHIPVVDSGNPVGIVSVRDVIRMILDERDTKIKYLEEYIYGADFPSK